MIKNFLLIIAACVFTTAHSQVTMTIVNRSSTTIDSIVIEGTKPFTIGPIATNSNKTFFVSVNQANFHAIAPFYVWVYSAALHTKMQWEKTGFVDTIYFFNHGLSSADKEPEQPKTFELYISNAGPEKPEPISTSDNAVTSVKELTPRSFVLTLDPQKLKPNKTVSIQLGKNVFTVDLNACNISDWNNRSGSAYVERNSIFIGFRKSLGPFEFVIDLAIEEALSSKDIQVSASNLLKTYVRENGRLVRAVFDYKSFKASPHFKVKVGPKTYRIKLKAVDIAETEYQQFSVSKRDIHWQRV